MQEKTRDSLRKAFFEAFFVVFGVILALGANEWRQNAAADRRADEALVTIEAELASNRELVRASMEYHQGQVALLVERMKAGEPVYPREFPKGFVFPAQIAHTAWEVAKETGAIANMDYETVLELSTVYAAHDRYLIQSETIGGLIYKKMLEGGIEAITDNHKNLMSIIYTFVYKEIALLEVYDGTLGTGDVG